MEKMSFLNSDFNKCVNIDLHLESNVSELEDPILIEHIKNSRQKKEEYKKQYQEDIIKTKEEIDEIQSQNARNSSIYLNKFNSMNRILTNSVENLTVQYSNIKKLNNDIVPYGYPQIEEFQHKNINLITKNSFKKNLDHLIQKLQIPVDNINDLNSDCIELEKLINVITRDYNLIIGQLFDFNQILLSKNEELLEKLYEYENVDDTIDDTIDDTSDNP
jgi:hypothetical protein